MKNRFFALALVVLFCCTGVLCAGNIDGIDITRLGRIDQAGIGDLTTELLRKIEIHNKKAKGNKAPKKDKKDKKDKDREVVDLSEYGQISQTQALELQRELMELVEKHNERKGGRKAKNALPPPDPKTK